MLFLNAIVAALGVISTFTFISSDAGTSLGNLYGDGGRIYHTCRVVATAWDICQGRIMPGVAQLEWIMANGGPALEWAPGAIKTALSLVDGMCPPHLKIPLSLTFES